MVKLLNRIGMDSLLFLQCNTFMNNIGV